MNPYVNDIHKRLVEAFEASGGERPYGYQASQRTVAFLAEFMCKELARIDAQMRSDYRALEDLIRMSETP